MAKGSRRWRGGVADFIVTPSDYEIGRLFDSMGEYAKARHHFELVMSGKNLELSPKKGKGKVSLQVSPMVLGCTPRAKRRNRGVQNMAVLRSNSALQMLKERGH